MKSKIKMNTYIKHRFIFLNLVASAMIAFSSCAKFQFTFTGASLDPEIKTFSVEPFYNEALDGPANLNINFTEALKEYYQRNTSLKIVGTAGDLEFSGKIKSYRVAPEAAGGGDLQNAQLQRLTIIVTVDFINNFDDEKSFSKDFSFFQQFDADKNLTEVENELIEEIFKQIVFDIFNSTVADW